MQTKAKIEGESVSALRSRPIKTAVHAAKKGENHGKTKEN